MKGFKHFFFILMMICLSTTSFAQKSKYQSIFIYNFTRYIQWPGDMQSGDFIIAVLGNSGIYDAMVDMANTKKQTQGMNLVIKSFDSISEIEKCHVLFVSDGFTNQLSDISLNPALSSTLIVTDKPGMAKDGATINFVEQDGRIKFELNRSNAEEKNLKVSGSLVNLAIVV